MTVSRRSPPGAHRRELRGCVVPAVPSGTTLASVLQPWLHSDWDASDPELVTPGGAVSSVPNTGPVSSTALAQASAGLRPTELNGVVTSDGTDALICDVSPAIDNAGRPYLFVVARLTALTSPKYLFGLWNSLAGSGSGGNVLALSINNGAWTFDRRDSSEYENAPAGLADTEWHVFEMGFTADGLGTLVVDGVARDSVRTGLPASDMSGMVVHDVHAVSQNYGSAMEWKRILLCSDEPTEGKKKEARDLLRTQHSVPANLLTDVQLFDTSTLESVFANPQSFGGAVTDGSRIFFMPAGSHCFLAVHDPSEGEFNDQDSWERFNMAAAPVSASTSRQWGVFGGQEHPFVYVAPYFGNDLVRHNTLGAVGSSSSYEVKSLAGVDANAYGFTGMVGYGVANRYVALVPSNNPLPALGLAVQYDQQALYSLNGSYKKFDCTQLDARAKGFSLGTTCGNYAFFVPWDAGSEVGVGDISGVLVWYDWTTDDFENPASWDHFDLTSINPAAKGLSGGVHATDGQHIWMVPVEQARGTLNGTVFVQLDTQAASFKVAGAYKFFDASVISPRARGYYEAVYDGTRYVYMIVFFSGLILRYDSWTNDFENRASWRELDFAAFKDGTVGSRFGGGVALNGAIYCPNSQYQWAIKIPAAV